jgi:type 1 glutamine amidotransferase
MSQSFILKVQNLKVVFLLAMAISVMPSSALNAGVSKKLKALIIDGQNHHVVWPKSTIMLKQYLEETGQFTVDIARTKYLYHSTAFQDWLPFAGVQEGIETAPKTDPNFNPDFFKYDVVISNLGYKAAPWPEQTQRSFEAYMKNGGGFVSVHSANNCFANWNAYNQMIAIGGWGGRTDKNGVYLYVDAQNKVVKDSAAGVVGVHGKREPFLVTLYNTTHPVTLHMPKKWMHAKDECYAYLRGPAENVSVLATSVSVKKDPELQQKEPVVMAIDYYKGRVFHTTLGHDTESLECVGFITLFKRGTEWAATGNVKRNKMPKDFPSKNKVSKRTFVYKP